VDLEITPEPTEAERAAILRALQDDGTDEPEEPVWWRAGLDAEED